MGKLKITKVKSTIKRHYLQDRTLEALGLRKMHQEVIKEDNSAIRGMIRKVRHLVNVEEIN